MIALHVYFLLSILIVQYSDAFKETLQSSFALDTFLPELHDLYSYAVHYDTMFISKRVFRSGQLYMIRVEKIKHVAGTTTHQLSINKGVVPSENSKQWTYEMKYQQPSASLKPEEFAKALGIIQSMQEFRNKEQNNRGSKSKDNTKFKYFSVYDIPIGGPYAEKDLNDNMIKDQLMKYQTCKLCKD